MAAIKPKNIVANNLLKENIAQHLNPCQADLFVPAI